MAEKQDLIYRFRLKTDDFKKKLRGASGAAKSFGAKIKGLFSKLGSALKSPIAGIVGLTAVFYKLGAAVASGVRNAKNIDKAFAEVNTLFDGPGGLTKSTKKAIRAQSDLYGSDMVSNIKGYYDIISSGITDQVKALEVLNESNKLAKAGLTDISTAADVVTSVMNSYGHETYEVSQITDLLFQTVKKGKTRIGELTQSLGQVVPLAAQAGLSFEELSAAIATTTAAGVKTPEVMTQIKGILNSFIKKEGKEANAVIEKLGYNWDVATFKTKGMSKMLGDLLRVTNGNVDEIGSLIPNIRGLAGIMALAGNEGENFNGNLEHMKNSAGATDEALKKIAETMSDKLKKSANLAKNEWGELGEKLLWVVNIFHKASRLVPLLFNKITDSIKEMVRVASFGKLFKTTALDQIVKAQEKSGSLKLEKPKSQNQVIEESKKDIKEKLELYEKTQTKIKDLYLTTINKIRDGVKRIRMEAEKAIEKIKASFGGRSFSLLAGAKGALQGNQSAQSAFQTFSGQVDIKSLNAKAIQDLAKASLGFSELGSEGKIAVKKLLNQIKDFKKEVTGEDVFGVVEAVKQGLSSDTLSQSLIELFKKSLGAQIDDVKAKEKSQTEKLWIEGLRSAGEAQTRITEEFNKATKDSLKAAEIQRLAAEAQQMASEQFIKAANTPINLKLKGDLSKIIETEFEKSRQNQTANVNR